MESRKVTGVTSNDNVTVVRMTGPAASRSLGDLVARIAAADIQLISYHKDVRGETAALTLVIDADDAPKLGGLAADFPIESQQDMSSVSVVGAGFACNAAAVSDLERLLAEAGVPVDYVGTSSLSVTCVVPRDRCGAAVKCLHDAFLGQNTAA